MFCHERACLASELYPRRRPSSLVDFKVLGALDAGHSRIESPKQLSGKSVQSSDGIIVPLALNRQSVFGALKLILELEERLIGF